MDKKIYICIITIILIFSASSISTAFQTPPATSFNKPSNTSKTGESLFYYNSSCNECSISESLQDNKKLEKTNLKTLDNGCKYESIYSVDELPDRFNWEDINGRNYLPSHHKGQGNCGSCWAFASIRALESSLQIETDQPNWDPDLAEQDLLSCSDCGDCDGGWPPLAYLKNTGVVPEECFPYKAKKILCLIKEINCPNWPSRVTKISDYGHIYWSSNYVEEVKKALIEHGPLIIVVRNSNGNRHATVLNGWVDIGEDNGYWLTGTYHEPFYPKPFPTDYAPRWIEAGLSPHYSLKLTSPIENEKLTKGDIYNITWEAKEFEGNVEIYYSTDGGETYPTLIDTVSADVGTFNWTIPKENSSKCRIKVRGVSEDNAYLYIPFYESGNFSIQEEDNGDSIFEIIIRMIIDFLKNLFSNEK